MGVNSTNGSGVAISATAMRASSTDGAGFVLPRFWRGLGGYDRTTVMLRGALPLSLLLVVGLMLTGCGSDEPEAPADRLEITLLDPEGAQSERRWDLTCDPPGGSLPDPDEVCGRLTADASLWEPVPPDAICTSEFGGPQRITVNGTLRGNRIDAVFGRSGGCEIARYDAIVEALGLDG